MRAADDADFSSFVAASSRRLLRGAYLITGDLAEAEDLLQTALERAYRRWPSIRAEGRAGSLRPQDHRYYRHRRRAPPQVRQCAAR